MRGIGSGSVQATFAEGRILEGMLDTEAFILRRIEETRRQMRDLQLAETTLRRATGGVSPPVHSAYSLLSLEV